MTFLTSSLPLCFYLNSEVSLSNVIFSEQTMESQQLHRPHDYAHSHDDDLHKPSGLHSMVEDEGEHHDHHDKKSVLKKVKAKAKKIKDTITKHGHGHEHEHDRDHDYHQNEEYEDEDEEMDEDPEIHGAPVYESAAISRVVPDHGINVGNPTAVGEDRYGTRVSDRILGMPSSQGQEQEQYPMQSGISLERPITTTTGIVHTPEDEQQGIGGLLHDLKEDPNYARPGTVPDSNYETKITDPTGKGGQEAEVTSLINALDNTRISDESFSKQSDGGYTGSHDQFAPQSYPTADEFAPRSVTATTDESIPKSYNASSSPEELPLDTLTGKSPHNQDQQSGYIGKISNATTAIADKAISAKNAVASKLGYGGGNEGGKTYEIAETKNEEAKPRGSSSPTEYAQRVAATVTEKLAPVYDKVADTGTAVIAKVKGSTTNAAGREGTTEGGGEGKVADKGVSVREYLSEKLKPGDEDRALSEVISETLHNKKNEGMGKSKEEDAAGAGTPPLGKVTESKEVARRLGSGTEKPREGDEAIAAGSESTGKGVVDRIKNAVNLWVSKGNQEDQQPPGLLGKGNSVAGETEERRLQESVN